MDLIIGGAYQGKLDYARERFHLEAEDLAFYENGYDTTRRCLCYLEQAVYDAVAAGRPFELPPLRADAVVICTDVSCGVVPMDRVQRLWREEVGRTVCALARRADSDKVKASRPDIPAVALFAWETCRAGDCEGRTLEPGRA